MELKEFASEFSDYVTKIVNKIKKYNEDNNKLPTIDYDFLELSNFDFNKKVLFISCLKATKKKIFDPIIIFKDNPELLLTYYLVEGKNLFNDLDKETFSVVNGGVSLDFTKVDENLKNTERMYKLHKVVNENKELKDKVIQNTIKYFEEYHNILLSEVYQNGDSECINSIRKLLMSKDVKFEDLKRLYENVVRDNPAFVSMDYDGLLLEKPEIALIPGYIENISTAGLLDYIGLYYNEDADITLEEIFNQAKLKEILEVNKDRTKSVFHFLMMIKEIDNGASYDDGEESIEEILSKDPEFKKAFEMFEEQTYTEAKRIYDGFDVEILNAIDLSRNSFFKNNLDKIIESYLNNNATNKDVCLAIILAFAENLRDSEGLDFDVVVNTKIVNNNTLGYYNDEDRILYINPTYINEGNLSFVNNISTIFHEVEHAIEFQKVFESDDYSYINLSMILDSILAQEMFSPYYSANYNNISYEIDARSAQYFKTLKFIDKFCPEVKEEFKKTFLYNLKNEKIRKTNIGYYSTALQLFLEDEEVMGSIRKEKLEDDKISEDTKDYYQKEIDKYKRYFSKFPVLEYDEKEYRFKLKSEEELNRLKEQYEKNNDPVGLDLVNNVIYDIKLAEFLDGKFLSSIDEAKEQVKEGLGGK